MSYKYKGFIPQNIAPTGAVQIGVYDENGNRVCEIPLGRLSRPAGEKLYSFGLLSDLHCSGNSASGTNLDNALTFFEDQGCLFCCHAGDMTNIGFFYNRGDTEMYLNQFAEYKQVCDAHPDLPVFGICGNHESYNSNITNNPDELRHYTNFAEYEDLYDVEGNALYYTYHHGNDLFIFVGQPSPARTIDKAQLQWLYETLEANRNIRCHVFVHVFPKGDSGNPKNCYAEAKFGEYEDTFMSLLSHYKNAILYHGHSHTKFISQELDEMANYTEENGFRSLHIPSSSSSRDVVLQSDGTYDRVPDAASSQGYVVDVYDNYIIFNGIEFNGEKPQPTGTYKIDTTLKTIEAGAYHDKTGVIT